MRPQHTAIGKIPRAEGVQRAMRAEQGALRQWAARAVGGDFVEEGNPQRLGCGGRGVHGQWYRSGNKRGRGEGIGCVGQSVALQAPVVTVVADAPTPLPGKEAVEAKAPLLEAASRYGPPRRVNERRAGFVLRGLSGQAARRGQIEPGGRRLCKGVRAGMEPVRAADGLEGE